MRQRRRSGRCACAPPPAAGKCAVHHCCRPLGCAVHAVAPCTSHASHRHSTAGCWEPVRVWWSVVWSIYLGELVGPTLSWAKRRKEGRGRLFCFYDSGILNANLGGSVARLGSTQKLKPTPITELAESRNRNRNRTTEQPILQFGSVRFGLRFSVKICPD